jgi:hypothetical protein
MLNLDLARVLDLPPVDPEIPATEREEAADLPRGCGVPGPCLAGERGDQVVDQVQGPPDLRGLVLGRELVERPADGLGHGRLTDPVPGADARLSLAVDPGKVHGHVPLDLAGYVAHVLVPSLVLALVVNRR